MFSIMSNLQIHYHFKLVFQKVDQHTCDTTCWIHGRDGYTLTGEWIQAGLCLTIFCFVTFGPFY